MNDTREDKGSGASPYIFNGKDFESGSGEHLGSLFEIRLPKERLSLCEECFAELRRIEKKYSRFLDDSELSRVNSALGIWHNVSAEFVFLLQKSLEFYDATGGNFDITLKSSLDSLGYDKDYSFRAKEKNGTEDIKNRKGAPETGENGEPANSESKPGLSGVIEVDAANNRILLKKQIEFGGFGKGYCLDRLAAILDSRGVKDYYINAGGDIFAKSSDSSKSWVVLLEHPDDPERAIGQITLSNKAIAGSAPNRRRWGKYHHLLNAKTGMPEDSVKCIFVIANTGLEADAYATALFTAGFEEGILLSKKLPVEILIVSSENKMYVSDGFNAEIYR